MPADRTCGFAVVPDESARTGDLGRRAATQTSGRAVADAIG
jgi:hypothetical protein